MKTIKVKDLMVSISDYAVVDEDATLLDAVLALEEAQKNFDSARYKHRAVLVKDKKGHIVGKVSQLDIVRALEPKYDRIRYRYEAHLGGFTREFISNMLSQFNLWEKPLEDISKIAVTRKVKKFMYTPSEGEFVEMESSLDEAIHQLVLGHHQSLLVLQDDEIVGILRLTDIFAAIFQMIKKDSV
jgi:CBS domain-containing protein